MSEKTKIIGLLQKAEINFDDVREVAERFKELTEISKLLEVQINRLKPILVDAKVLELFPDDGQKVVFVEGRALTEIDTTGLFDMLFKAGRMWDFVRVASVTATSLGKLEDGAALEAKFKTTKGKAADSVSLKEMSKDDWKKIG